MPLEDGRAWSFQITAVDDSLPPGSCPDPMSSVNGTRPTAEGPGLFYSPACVEGSFAMVQDGDDVTAYDEVALQGPGIPYMREPVEDGAGWDAYVWREAGQMVVPAGTFDDCWRREWADQPGEWVAFCRGVGLVQSESAYTNLRTLLSSKNF